MTMRTLFGNKINYDNGCVSKVDIKEIAHSLSTINRFAGHTVVPYNVAQHSILVSQLVPDDCALEGLMHDAAEAYIGDIVRPLKKLFPGLKDIEESLMIQIRDKYRLRDTSRIRCQIRVADDRLLATEMLQKEIYPQDVTDCGTSMAEPYSDILIVPWGWEISEIRFLERFKELT